MNLSVVIRCKDDERVFGCIDSIDEDVEVVVVLNENNLLEKRLSRRGATVVESPSGNLSVVSNYGLEGSRWDKVMFTDSDTIFQPGCIGAVCEALDNHLVARTALRFKQRPGDFQSRLVAEARDYVNSLPLAFTPGLGIRREVVEKIGGFAFNDVVPFAVDADLDLRIKKAGVEVAYLKGAVVEHDVESIRHDLKAARRIGRGCRTSAESLAGMAWMGGNATSLGKELKAVKPTHYGDILRRKGLGVLAYQLAWDANFYAGYHLRGWRI